MINVVSTEYIHPIVIRDIMEAFSHYKECCLVGCEEGKIGLCRYHTGMNDGITLFKAEKS